MPTRSKSTRKTGRSSMSLMGPGDDSREPFLTYQKSPRGNGGIVERLQGVEDIFFGAVGELGHSIVGNKKGARKSAEVFEEGVDILLGRKYNETTRAASHVGHRGVDINLLRNTYFEGYDAGIHAGVTRAESEAAWYMYNQPKYMGDAKAPVLSKTRLGNAKALKKGPDSEITS